MARFSRLDTVEGYYSAVETEWPKRNVGNLRFHLDHLFDGVELSGARVLDVGAGDGLYSFYAAAKGADRVVALEPEADGSTAGVREHFESLGGRLGFGAVELFPDTSTSSIPATSASTCCSCARRSTTWTSEPRAPCTATTRRARLPRPAGQARGDERRGAKLIVADCTRHNLFARLGVRNPLQPTIEWDKHQAPETWVDLLEEVGFGEPRVRWGSLNSLRGPGRALMGNRFANWLTLGAFCLTMTFKQPAIVTA